MASFCSLHSNQSKTWFSEVCFFLPAVGALLFSLRIIVYYYKSTFGFFCIFKFQDSLAWCLLFLNTLPYIPTHSCNDKKSMLLYKKKIFLLWALILSIKIMLLLILGFHLSMCFIYLNICFSKISVIKILTGS